MENKEEVKYNFTRGGSKDFDGFDIDIKQSEYDSKDFIIFIGTDEFQCATASIPKTEIGRIKTVLDEIEGVKSSATIQDKETINLFPSDTTEKVKEIIQSI